MAASLLGDTGRAERALVRLLAVAATLAALTLGAWTTGLGEASGA